jgi:hypothetical protein
MNNKYLAALAVCLVSLTPAAQAEVGIGLRGGTMGFGADFDIGMTEKLNLRLGYNFLNYDYEVEDTDVTYDGELEIESFSALLDWHAFGGSFRFTAGAYSAGPTILLNGTPAPGTTVEIGDSIYTASQVGSLRGEIEFGDSVTPYVGIGFGNVVDKDGRVSFLFDIGVMFSGAAEVTMTPVCGTAAPEGSATCNQIKQDVQQEIDELEEDSSDFEMYPVISLGIGIRF